MIGQEITRLWAALRLEATQAAHWLDTEVPNALACEVSEIGYGSVTWETAGTALRTSRVHSVALLGGAGRG